MESKIIASQCEVIDRSCCSPVTCCGVPIETGCYVFSIINAILSTLYMLGSLGFLGFGLSMWLDGQARSQNDMVLVWLFTGLAIACCVGSFIALIFAVFLCVGLKKNRPRYIMAYLVYGIITTVLSVAGIVTFIWMEWEDVFLVMYAMIPLGVCVIYSVLLLLVYQTHAVLSARTPITGHRRLLSNDC